MAKKLSSEDLLEIKRMRNAEFDNLVDFNLSFDQVSPSLEVDPLAIEISKKIVDYWGAIVYKVILFGSRARGDYHEDSDYDILILGDFVGTDIRTRVKDIQSVLRRPGLLMDLIPYTTVELSESLLEDQIRQEGILLYIRGE